MSHSIDSTFYDKKLAFLGIFLFVALSGVILISVASYHAARELDIIHDVENMERILAPQLKASATGSLYPPNKAEKHHPLFLDSSYHFYRYQENRWVLLSPGKETIPTQLEQLKKKSQPVKDNAGYFENANTTYTWLVLKNTSTTGDILVLHQFSYTDVSILWRVYQNRMFVPVIFYLLVMIWVSQIFNHLLKKLKAQKQQMEHMALHDALTGLANRNILDDRIKKLIHVSRRDKSQFLCLLIDIDNFKTVNDVYGHSYGDELLRQVAARLKTVLRESDTAIRLGGDEFVVLLGKVDTNSWQHAIDRMHDTLTRDYTLLDIEYSIQLSIGVSIYGKDGEDAASLLNAADKAMYKVKGSGGGVHACYDCS